MRGGGKDIEKELPDQDKEQEESQAAYIVLAENR